MLSPPPELPDLADRSMLDDTLAVMRLLQLASPALPVGAYSYSQALERAVADGLVYDPSSAIAWIEDVLRFAFASFELPALGHMVDAAGRCDAAALADCNAQFLASRESAELRAETVQMGRSMARLISATLAQTGVGALLAGTREISYPCAWACAGVALGLARKPATAAYAWSWLENQVLAAVKLIPLGQSAGQRMLLHLGDAAARACDNVPEQPQDWTNLAPGLAIVSALHETQYSRLFRS